MFSGPESWSCYRWAEEAYAGLQLKWNSKAVIDSIADVY